MLKVLPVKIASIFGGINAILHSISPLAFVALVTILVAFCAWMHVLHKRYVRRALQKKEYFKNISGMSSLQEMLAAFQ